MISTPELFPFAHDWGKEELWGTVTQKQCLLIGFREEWKASLIGAFMLARGVSRRRTVQIASQ